MDENLFSLSIASLHASLHSIRMLANQGLVSPSDVDASLDGITESLEKASSDFVALIQPSLDPIFAEIKQSAARNWQGN
ncbi:hypothetical protein [Parasphingorhabdus sp.]|uniref:hypothetical protein n=1 Tax=Parasphingorhabdus sp. TaxID=2709688 RepID=UPI003D2BBD96